MYKHAHAHTNTPTKMCTCIYAIYIHICVCACVSFFQTCVEVDAPEGSGKESLNMSVSCHNMNIPDGTTVIKG